MKKIYGYAFFVTFVLSSAFLLSDANASTAYKRVWMESKTGKVLIVSSRDKRSYQNIKVKGLKLRYPSRKRCSSATLSVLERDLELNALLETLEDKSFVDKSDFKIIRKFPYCKKHHFHFAVFSKVLNEGYKITKIELLNQEKKGFTSFLAGLF